MRLIDADEFKKQIAAMAITNNYPADKANKMCELIDCQPAAYDVDKVVKQLEGLEKWNNEKDLCRFTEGYGCAIDEAIEIVKSGGID